MDSRLLDVFHDAPMRTICPVANCIHIDLHGVLQEVVYENRMLARDRTASRILHFKASLIIDHLHGAAP